MFEPMSNKIRFGVALAVLAAAHAAAAVRVWNYEVLEDAMRAVERPPLLPVVIAGARGGIFSGAVAVESSEPLRGLRAAVVPGVGREPRLPAGRAIVRYALPWEDGRPGGLDVLYEQPPAEVPVRGARALAGIWVTVEVPADAAPGVYGAELRIEAEGLPAAATPIELRVADWIVPDPQQWRTWAEMIQSPDTLAVEYGVPLWSERHWELIARSFRLISGTGSRVVYLPLLRHTNQGNAESMVRWIRGRDGALRPDYTIAERYLDLARRHLGEPKLVVLYAWDAYLVLSHRNTSYAERPQVDPNAGEYEKMLQRRAQQRWDLRQGGLTVTIVDEATGEVEDGFLPHYTAPDSRDLWAPVYAELRRRMRERGLEGAMALGMVSDMEPSKEEVEFLRDVSGGLPWAAHSHYQRTRGRPAPNRALKGIADIAYEAQVYRAEFQTNPDRARAHGWRAPELRAWLDRVNLLNGPALTARLMPEINITGAQRGIGRMGGDFWPALRDARGRRAPVFTRYPANQWRGLDLSNYFLAPGPDGALATARFENLREALQECEARIRIEESLLDPERRRRIGEPLAQRAQAALDERQRAMWRGVWYNEEHLAALSTLGAHGNARWPVEGIEQALPKAGHPLPAERGAREAVIRAAQEQGRAWFAASGWKERNAQLFALAGEVERAGR